MVSRLMHYIQAFVSYVWEPNLLIFDTLIVGFVKNSMKGSSDLWIAVTLDFVKQWVKQPSYWMCTTVSRMAYKDPCIVHGSSGHCSAWKAHIYRYTCWRSALNFNTQYQQTKTNQSEMTNNDTFRIKVGQYMPTVKYMPNNSISVSRRRKIIFCCCAAI